MTKAFYEVFRELKLDEAIYGIFNDALVERIYIDSANRQMVIHMTLSEIVHPSQIEALESIIKDHLSIAEVVKVTIKETYQLADPMPFPLLYQFYQSSLGYLIKREYPLCGVKILKGAPIIDGLTVRYELSDQMYQYFLDKKMDLVIETIYQEKFGLKIHVTIAKELGQELVEQFIENRAKEQEAVIRRMTLEDKVDSANAAKKPKKSIKKTDVEDEQADNVLVGKNPIIGDIMFIKEFDESTTEVIIDGELINIDVRDIKDKKLVIFDLYDTTSTITCKFFISNDLYDRNIKDRKLKAGKCVRLKGKIQFDTYNNENVIFVKNLELIDDFRVQKVDEADIRRVELHAHTQMSDMDAIVSASDLVNKALYYGHKAIAITDHGVVQAFPDAFHAAQGKDIKIIYGVEGYLVDDEKPTIKGESNSDFDDVYVVFDLETTGFHPGKDTITEIGAVKIKDRVIIDRFSTFVNPDRDIPLEVQKLTSIRPDMVSDAPSYSEALKEFMNFVGDANMVAHNADFDMGFIYHFANIADISVPNTSIDTVEMGRTLYPELNNYKLKTLAKNLEVKLSNHHRAVYDAEATAEVFLVMIRDMDGMNIHGLKQYVNYEQLGHKSAKKLRPTHVIILAQNLVGLKNLYKLISLSHIDHFYNLRPRIPKSILRKMREGLIIGSACESGELFSAFVNQRGPEEIDRIASFYDYYEIQPLGNNEFLVRDNVFDSKEDIIHINKQIIELGKAHNKLVVATGDVHFLNPEDEIYRRVLMGAKGYKDADNQPPLYFRTTEEMMNEFYYLDKETAYELVVTNTNKIADMIEAIEPVPRDKYAPKIEGSDEELRTICYEKAHQLYGDELPEIVVLRLEKELNSIINNGFAVMYIIAQKLVWKSMEDGYLVGSRGSVGSSFAATMAGITEVNPLPAHYICENCHYIDFESEVVTAHSGNSGYDLPDADCPVCGKSLKKEGHDIPFETFLGFDGDKEPDIDLNFSGDYQSRAHDYTEELFGKGFVFRAGTIGTLAEKTAYGLVNKYMEEHEEHLTKAERNQIVSGCLGVRRTTGQHPGGIIVVPRDQEIYSFTPIQRPANDMKTNIITTHFDYHSIDHNLLKLDLLGHDDPSMIKMLEDLTGVDAKSIPFDEPKVMSLFDSTEALELDPKDIDGCKLGSLGIPEFGTDFVMQMLTDTKPKTFSDLARISGLSHGTDVWINNAQEIIKEDKANISEVISTRDDIMTYLIHMKLDKKMAFNIMESVRRGRGLTPEWEDEMLDHEVPEWYIWSCKQIKYMFPKAHAVAYVMMAFRIAYFKVYHPLAYYTAFFSIRASNFDYEIMCHGKDQLDLHIKEFKERLKNNLLSKKEQDMIKDMRIVQEMYARGYQFKTIDLYTVEANKFQIVEGKIMPSLSAIQGLGEKAAEMIVQVRKDGKFLSIEDLSSRAKISKTVIEVMRENQILQGMQDTNQIDLFAMLGT